MYKGQKSLWLTEDKLRKIASIDDSCKVFGSELDKSSLALKSSCSKLRSYNYLIENQNNVYKTAISSLLSYIELRLMLCNRSLFRLPNGKLFKKFRAKSRQRKHSLQKVIQGISYLVKTGCQWRMLPSCYPKWQLVYYYFSLWRDNGLIEELLHHLREKP